MAELKENPFLKLRELYAESDTDLIHQQMIRWMRMTLEWVDDILVRHPPTWPEPEIRRRSLYMLDEPLHVFSAPVEPPIAEFLNRRIQEAVLQIESEKVTDGITIWKLYNHGFVIKTPEIAIGFDLHRGPFESFHIESHLFDRILQVTQALFISHEHGDHADPYAVSQMIELDKPVVTPPDLWQDDESYPQLIRPERDWNIEHHLALDDTTITFRVFPGHQSIKLLNNVYLVDLPGAYHVMHTGDQSESSDFDVWIDRVNETFDIDVLLPNCWTTDLPRFFRGVCPRLVITGHENEMAHTVDHREAFSKTYSHIVDEPTPVIVMAWGERYHFERPKG